MKFNLRKRKKYLIAGGLLLATATPSFAIFGLGDIVFDPTSYASLVSQLTTLDTQYNMLKNNITHFSFKQQWQTTLSALKNANVANMFGETAHIFPQFETINPLGMTITEFHENRMSVDPVATGSGAPVVPSAPQAATGGSR